MQKLVIEGGTALQGSIRISGSKNATLPILMAGLMLDSEACFENVPNLRDVRTTLQLLEILGCETSFQAGVARVRVRALQAKAPYDLVKTMRASVLVLGPLLAKLGEARVAMPGGCAIGARPVDLHLTALEAMGASFELEDGYIIGRCKQLKGTNIQFANKTVGGTENLLMAAALAQGQTILSNAACEPEIVDLANFLIACGAKIKGQGTDTIVIDGVSSLHGAKYSIMPDRIEAGTFIAAAAITQGELLLTGCPSHCMGAILDKFSLMGLKYIVKGQDLLVQGNQGNGQLKCIDLHTDPYPGFPTDMQAQIMVSMCFAEGVGIINETIFENRFMHVQELVRLGADIRLAGHMATVRGVKNLVGAPVMASDLRASASLVLAGLMAKGKTDVQRIYHLDRGYEEIELKLSQVGAKISRQPE